MVSAKRIGTIFALILAAWGIYYFFPSRTRQVKRQLKAVEHWIDKDGPEGNLTIAREASEAADFFAPECAWDAPAYDLNGSFTVRDAARYYFAARDRFSSLSVRFYDVAVAFPSKNAADVTATVRITGVLKGGGDVGETHEIQCRLTKTGGTWLIDRVTVVQVLQR